MDSKEAKIFELREASFEQLVIQAPKHHLRRLPKAEQTRDHNHPDDEHRFFREIGIALRGQDEILVLGPSLAKLRFLRFARQHESVVEARIVGLETADHPTDVQVVAHARQYFAPQAASAN
jgi:hypothetical protein